MPAFVDTILGFLLKFPPHVLSRGDLIMAPVVPTWVVGMLAFAVLGLVVVRYAGVASLTVRDRTVLGVLRALSLLLVVGCLLRPGVVLASAVPQRNVFALLFDDSRSMRLSDAGEASRLAQLQSAFADTSAITKRLGERFAIKRFRFNAGASPVASVAELTGSGTRSDLGRALNDLRGELAGLPLAGVVLVTDGADNGSTRYEDAVQAFRDRRIPVSTVGIGLERFDRDVAIERVEVPTRPLAGAALLVGADIRVRGAGRRPTTVTVEADGRLVATDSVRAPRSGDVARLQLRVPPLAAGVHRLTIRARPLPDEPVPENNDWHTTLEVRAGPDRVLYVEGEPRPEFAFLRRAVAKDSGLQVVGLMRSADRKFLRLGVRDSLELLGGFPTSREELFAYRALILGSIEAAFFSADQLRLIADFVSQRGGGLLVLGGRSSLSEGGYAGTPLDPVLPMTLTRGTPNLEGPATALAIRPTRAGEQHPALQLRGTLSESRPHWDSLPPLTMVNEPGTLRTGATMLLAGRREGDSREVPVLAWQRYGRGKSATFLVQDSWLWRMDASIPVEDLTHQTYWRQLLRWLTDESPERFELAVSPTTVAPGDEVELRAQLADRRFADVNDATVSAAVTTPMGSTITVPLEWSLGQDGAYRGRFTATDSGRYAVVASAQRQQGRERAIPDSAEATILATAEGADVANAEQRPALLRRMAEATGGRYYPLEEAGRLADDAVFTEAGVIVRDAHDLWDMPLVFMLLVCLLGAEWGYRRWRGLA